MAWRFLLFPVPVRTPVPSLLKPLPSGTGFWAEALALGRGLVGSGEREAHKRNPSLPSWAGVSAGYRACVPEAFPIPPLTTTKNMPFGSSKPFCPQFAPGRRSVSRRRRSWDGFMTGQAGGLRRLQSWHHLEHPCWDCLSLWALPPLHTGQQEGDLSGAGFQEAARGPRPGRGVQVGMVAPPPAGRGPWVSAGQSPLPSVPTGQPEWSSPKQTGSPYPQLVAFQNLL